MYNTLVFTILCAALFFCGCKKQESTIPQEKKETAPVEDTTFSEPEEFRIDTSKDAAFREESLDVAFKEKVTRNLKTIYFGYDQHSLTDSAIEKLQNAAQFLQDNPQLRILLEGHCDQRGSSEYNMGLGESRARRVKEYIINYGIDAIRLEVTSWGEERPAVSGCASEPCFHKNRRVEFKVIQRR